MTPTQELRDLVADWKEDPCFDLGETSGLTPPQKIIAGDIHDCWTASRASQAESRRLREEAMELTRQAGIAGGAARVLANNARMHEARLYETGVE